MTNKIIKNEKVFTITQPRITEKASFLFDQNVYTFNIPKNTTKTEVRSAILKMYKVSPEKIRVVNSKPKKVFVRGKSGTKAGNRKAYVYLKKGDKIEIS